MPVSAPTDAVEYVFVYGTLRKDASNSALLKGAEWVSGGVIRGRLFKRGWFPALVLDLQASTWVRGDVFRIRSGPNLDAFLKYEGLEAGAVEGKDCRMVEVAVRASPISVVGWDVLLWEWTGPEDEADLIPTGDWIDVERPGSRLFFTWIAAACALTMPAIAVATTFVRDLRSVPGFEACALLAPVAGWFALYFATRRRECGEVARLYTLTALFLESIPLVIGLASVIADAVRRIF